MNNLAGTRIVRCAPYRPARPSWQAWFPRLLLARSNLVNIPPSLVETRRTTSSRKPPFATSLRLVISLIQFTRGCGTKGGLVGCIARVVRCSRGGKSRAAKFQGADCSSPASLRARYIDHEARREIIMGTLPSQDWFHSMLSVGKRSISTNLPVGCAIEVRSLECARSLTRKEFQSLIFLDCPTWKKCTDIFRLLRFDSTFKF